MSFASKVPKHAPTGHIPVAFKKTGVLLANLGTPDGYDYRSMRRYLNEFLSDRRVIDYPPIKWQPILQLIVLTKRPFTSGAAYRSIWNEEKNESPLLTITREQSEKLATKLHAHFGEEVIVEYCMRYGNPSTKTKLRDLIDAGCQKILFFPLYPQYAAATTATANDQLFRALMKQKWQPSIRVVPPYYDDAGYIAALADSIERGFAELDFEPQKLVVSYHGLPERYLLEGDPYHCHCMKTSRLLNERLGWESGKLITTFQSRFGPEEWLKPYTVDEVARIAKSGANNIAVIAPGFSSDCIETLEEINDEIQDSFKDAGGERFAYIPCLNSDDSHIEVLTDLVCRNLQGWVDRHQTENL